MVLAIRRGQLVDRRTRFPSQTIPDIGVSAITRIELTNHGLAPAISREYEVRTGERGGTTWLCESVTVRSSSMNRAVDDVK